MSTQSFYSAATALSAYGLTYDRLVELDDEVQLDYILIPHF